MGNEWRQQKIEMIKEEDDQHETKGSFGNAINFIKKITFSFQKKKIVVTKSC